MKGFTFVSMYLDWVVILTVKIEAFLLKRKSHSHSHSHYTTLWERKTLPESCIKLQEKPEQVSSEMSVIKITKKNLLPS